MVSLIGDVNFFSFKYMCLGILIKIRKLGRDHGGRGDVSREKKIEYSYIKTEERKMKLKRPNGVGDGKAG